MYLLYSGPDGWPRHVCDGLPFCRRTVRLRLTSAIGSCLRAVRTFAQMGAGINALPINSGKSWVNRADSGSRAVGNGGLTVFLSNPFPA